MRVMVMAIATCTVLSTCDHLVCLGVQFQMSQHRLKTTEND